MTTRDFSPVEIEASEWLLAMNDRSVSLQDRAHFEAWLAADPEHERIYRLQKSAWSAVAAMPELLHELREEEARPISRITAIPAVSRRNRISARTMRAALAATVALCAVALVVLTGGAPRLVAYAERLFSPSDTFATAVAQIKDVQLEDGSLVTLGAASELDVSFTPTERRVVLGRGEAYFEVTKDPARPFFVDAGNATVRVVGTRFDVHYGTDTVRIAVLEGGVEAATSHQHGSPSIQVLTAGDILTLDPAGKPAAIRTFAQDHIASWRTGRLVYVDARLRDVVADINRYYDGEITLADDRLGDLQFTASLRPDQIDRMLEMLTSVLPIEAERVADRHIVLSAK